MHDRNRFELFGFDNGFDDGEIRQRINAAFDHISDISHVVDTQAASEIKNGMRSIFSIDLNGFFGEGRTEVFSYRPAPIQVNYLGFPGTIGASYMDYIIADRA